MGRAYPQAAISITWPRVTIRSLPWPRKGSVLLTLLLLVVVAPPACGQDLAGTWLLAVDLGSGGGGQVTFVLEQEGSAISGTYSGSYGTLVPLSGTAEDGRIRLSFTTEGVGEITYDGAMVADTMRGSVTYGDVASGTFEGTMRPPATWVSTYVAYSVMALLLLLALRMALPGAPRGRER